MVNLVSVSPEDKDKRKEFLESRLGEYGYLREGASFKDIEDRVRYAENWVADFSQLDEVKVELDNQQKDAITILIKSLKTAETADDIQTAIFETAKRLRYFYS